MQPIGGEIHYKKDDLFRYMTDSGRSSIRLLLKSGLKDKKFLLPDFLCKVVLSVFDELSVNYSLYKVREDLSIDVDEINKQDFDVLYIINFFGKTYYEIYRHIDEEKYIIEDCVFLPVIDYTCHRERWAAFNSFRKISFLSDGSLLKSTFNLNENLIIHDTAPFSEIKYDAKRIKHEFLNKNEFSEEEYLALFNKAEEVIDDQREIYAISGSSLFALIDYYSSMNEEYSIRNENIQVLDKYLSAFSIQLTGKYISHYIIKVNRRDELREYLFSEKIFLPVHWPHIPGIENSLYNKIISIPVDSRYNSEDMYRVAQNILSFYNK